MPGLVPGIHVLLIDYARATKTWMAGTSPAMTKKDAHRGKHQRPKIALAMMFF
jgi:hypothetical protein